VIIYGRNPVTEALRGKRRVHEVLATSSAARDLGLDARIASAEEIARLAGSDAHQGVCARVDPYPYVDPSALLAAARGLLVVLDEIQDPQNLGAVCRTAEVAGALGVVIPERRAAEVTPAVCKASAGAVEHLAIARVRNIADFLADAQAAGFWCYGAAAGAARSAFEIDWPEQVALVLGAEGKGLRPRVAKACDELISLPMRGRLDSLNVSATAAVLTYLALQREFRP
jgi:23S rRNA (guanosine2251-2'-O)-methyltransferase